MKLFQLEINGFHAGVVAKDYEQATNTVAVLVGDEKWRDAKIKACWEITAHLPYVLAVEEPDRLSQVASDWFNEPHTIDELKNKFRGDRI